MVAAEEPPEEAHNDHMKRSETLNARAKAKICSLAQTAVQSELLRVHNTDAHMFLLLMLSACSGVQVALA